jgi:hypothetical protein
LEKIIIFNHNKEEVMENNDFCNFFGVFFALYLTNMIVKPGKFYCQKNKIKIIKIYIQQRRK